MTGRERLALIRWQAVMVAVILAAGIGFTAARTVPLGACAAIESGR